MTGVRFSARITVDGKDLATSADAVRAGVPAVIDGLTFQWGRASRLDQPEIGSMNATLLVPPEAARATLDQLTPGGRVVAYTSYRGQYLGNSTQNLIPGEVILREGESVTVPPAPLTGESIGDQWAHLGQWDPVDEIYRTGLWYTLTAAPAVFALQARPVYYKTVRDPAPTYGPWTLVGAMLGKQWRIGHNRPGSADAANQLIGLDPARKGCYIGWELKALSAKATLIREAKGTFREASGTLAHTSGVAFDGVETVTTLRPQTEFTIFAGRIASSPITWDEKAGQARINMACNEWTIDVKNKKIGDKPWDVELLSIRLERICQLAGIKNGPGPGHRINPITPYRDVDARSALDLIHEYATAGGLVVWPSFTDVDGELFLMEGQDGRISLLKLGYAPDGQARIEVGGPGEWTPTIISAAAITRSGIVVDRDVATLASSVRITGLTYTKDAESWTDGKNLAEMDTLVSDPGRFTVHGAHEVHVIAPILTPNDSTVTKSIFGHFSNENTPEDLARAILARTAPGQWQITGMSVNGRAPAVNKAQLFNLLCIYTRPGRPLLLTDMPEWMPGAPAIPVYLDGGTCTLSGGYWTCALTVTHGASQGQSVTLAETSPHLVSQFANITFADAATAHA